MKKIVFHLSFPCYPTSNRTALWLTARMSVPVVCTFVRRQFRRLSRKTAVREAARLLRRLRPRTYEMSQMQRVTQRHHCTQYSRRRAGAVIPRPGSYSTAPAPAPAAPRRPRSAQHQRQSVICLTQRPPPPRDPTTYGVHRRPTTTHGTPPTRDGQFPPHRRHTRQASHRPLPPPPAGRRSNAAD